MARVRPLHHNYRVALLYYHSGDIDQTLEAQSHTDVHRVYLSARRVLRRIFMGRGPYRRAICSVKGGFASSVTPIWELSGVRLNLFECAYD